VEEIEEDYEMQSMTSREIHNAIVDALGEVSRALASGQLDRSGRYYSDSDLRERFAELSLRRDRRLMRDSKPLSSPAEPAGR